MITLDSKTRAKLRSLASVQDPVGQVGKEGVTESVAAWVSDALRARELIKITVLKNCDTEPKDVAVELAEATDSTVVTVIGFKVILYKKSDKVGITHVLDDGKKKPVHSEPNAKKKAAERRAKIMEAKAEKTAKKPERKSGVSKREYRK